MRGIAARGWTHVVGTYDGSVLPDRTNGFTIGAKGSDTPSYFKGELDEIAVYDKALDPARIAAHIAAAGK